MIHSVFKSLRVWLVTCFESLLRADKREQSIEFIDIMSAVHTFLRGSAGMPLPSIAAASKGKHVKPFKALLAKNNIFIKHNTFHTT